MNSYLTWEELLAFREQAALFTESLGQPQAKLGPEEFFKLRKLLSQYQDLSPLKKPFNEDLYKQCLEAGLVSADPNFLGYVIPAIQESRNNDMTVLIEGESGTGKEMVADCIWKTGSRSGKEMIKINCGALTNELASSELFGHQKGAFTGAHQKKKGFFETADGGILFLDEISELSKENQVKLLRVLGNRSVQPLGSTNTVEVDVKVIAASNKKLEDEVKEGRFREDLFNRLNRIRINLLPLYLRPGDLVPLLINSIRRHNEKMEQQIELVCGWVIFELFAYDWPGNVRSLDSMVQRACNKVDNKALFTLGLAFDPSYQNYLLQGKLLACCLSLTPLFGKLRTLSNLLSEGTYETLNEIDSLIPEEFQENREYWKLSKRLPHFAKKFSISIEPMANPSSLGSQEGQVALPPQGGEQQTGALQPDPQEDPYAPIYGLTKSELLEKYARGIIARNPSTSAAAKAASVSRQTIRIWKEKYALSQQ